MTATQTLIREIETFSASVGYAPSTITLKAAQDGKMYARLKRGGTVTLETAERLRSWMRMHGRKD